MYVIAAQLRADGIDGEVLSWVVSKKFVETGGGLAVGGDSVTREISDLGTAASDDSPTRDYTDTVMDSAQAKTTQACAGD